MLSWYFRQQIASIRCHSYISHLSAISYFMSFHFVARVSLFDDEVFSLGQLISRASRAISFDDTARCRSFEITCPILTPTFPLILGDRSSAFSWRRRDGGERFRLCSWVSARAQFSWLRRRVTHRIAYHSRPRGIFRRLLLGRVGRGFHWPISHLATAPFACFSPQELLKNATNHSDATLSIYLNCHAPHDMSIRLYRGIQWASCFIFGQHAFTISRYAEFASPQVRHIARSRPPPRPHESRRQFADAASFRHVVNDIFARWCHWWP